MMNRTSWTAKAVVAAVALALAGGLIGCTSQEKQAETQPGTQASKSERIREGHTGDQFPPTSSDAASSDVTANEGTEMDGMSDREPASTDILIIEDEPASTDALIIEDEPGAEVTAETDEELERRQVAEDEVLGTDVGMEQRTEEDLQGSAEVVEQPQVGTVAPGTQVQGRAPTAQRAPAAVDDDAALGAASAGRAR